jgi:hypothetical protein
MSYQILVYYGYSGTPKIFREATKKGVMNLISELYSLKHLPRKIVINNFKNPYV